jgi:hypothetical protein
MCVESILTMVESGVGSIKVIQLAGGQVFGDGSSTTFLAATSIGYWIGVKDGDVHISVLNVGKK